MSKSPKADAPTPDAADAPPAHGVNATPQQIAIDEYRERVQRDPAALRAALADVATIVEGDTAGTAYTKAKAGLAPLQVTLPEMVTWYPNGKEDAFDKLILQTHADISPETSAAAYSLMSDALLAAVCASDEAIGVSARVGAGTEKEPQFKYVRVRDFCDAALPADKRGDRFPGTQADAKAKIDAELAAATSAGAKDAIALWTQARDAVDNVVNLRRMASDLAALSMRKSKWRRNLYVNVAAAKLDEYATRDPKPITPIGRVWSDALGKAQSAHAEYMRDTGKAGKAPTTAGLQAAIDAALDAFLELKAGPKAKKIKSEDEQQKAAVAAMWRSLDEVDKLFGTKFARAIERKLADMKEDGEDVHALQRANVSKAEENAARQRAEEEAEKLRLQQEADAASEADDDAKAQRDAQRKAQRDAANGEAEPAEEPTKPSAGPTRRSPVARRVAPPQ